MSDDDKKETFFQAVKQLSERPTLRDQFAMAALTGFCWSNGSDDVGEYDSEYLATTAYQMADAMLKARNSELSSPSTPPADVPSAAGAAR